MAKTIPSQRSVHIAASILMLVCVGANLIAAILAIRAGNKYRQLACPKTREGLDKKEGSK
jgi:hypothetical protein